MLVIGPKFDLTTFQKFEFKTGEFYDGAEYPVHVEGDPWLSKMFTVSAQVSI